MLLMLSEKKFPQSYGPMYCENALCLMVYFCSFQTMCDPLAKSGLLELDWLMWCLTIPTYVSFTWHSEIWGVCRQTIILCEPHPAK